MRKLTFVLCLLVAAASFYLAHAATEPAQYDLKCGKLEGVLQVEDHEYSYFIDNQNITLKYAKDADEAQHIRLAASTNDQESVCIGTKVENKKSTPVFTVGKTVEDAKKTATL